MNYVFHLLSCLQYGNKVQNSNVRETSRSSSGTSCDSCSFVFPDTYFCDATIELTTHTGAPQSPQVTGSRTSLSLSLGSSLRSRLDFLCSSFNSLPAHYEKTLQTALPALPKSILWARTVVGSICLFFLKLNPDNLFFCVCHVFRTSDYSHGYLLVPIQPTSPFPLAFFSFSLPLLAASFEY